MFFFTYLTLQVFGNFSLLKQNAWDITYKLEENGIIKSQAALSVKSTISFATIIRLKTYSHRKAQRENLSVFNRLAKTESEFKERFKQIFYLTVKDLGEQGELFQYFYTALPFHETINDFCSKCQTLNKTCRQSFFKNNNFYKNDCATKGPSYSIYSGESLNNLGVAYSSKNCDDEAVECYKNSLKIYKVIYNDEPNPNVAFFAALGIACAAKLQHDEAIKYYDECIRIYKHVYHDEPHENIALSFRNVRLVYNATGQYDKAIECYEESLKVYKLIYQDRPNPNVVTIFNSLGNVYKNKTKYDQAAKYYEESLMIEKLISIDKLTLVLLIH
nr:kinesin light chain-like [Hydra vulgaris]